MVPDGDLRRRGSGRRASDGEQTHFTVSQVLQFLALVLAGALAWGNLKGDFREVAATMVARLNDHERRIEVLEHETGRELRQGQGN